MSFVRFRNRVRVVPRGATRTEQHWKNRCSIANMVKRYISGDKSVVRNCHFADVSEMPDNLHDFLAYNFNVADAFDNLDEVVRSKFATPSELLEALETGSDEDLFRQVGILKPLEKPVDPPTAPVPPVTAADGGEV